MKVYRRAGVVGVCVLSLACSKGSGGGGAAPSTGASAAEPEAGPSYGIRPGEVLLGEPAAFTGPSAALGVEMWRGATAAFAASNDAGGIHGRKIRPGLADDADQAETTDAAVGRPSR